MCLPWSEGPSFKPTKTPSQITVLYIASLYAYVAKRIGACEIFSKIRHEIKIETHWKIVYWKFYIRGSVHRNSRLKKSNKMQQYTDIYLLLNYCTCFGRPSRPSSGVRKTAVVASGTDHTVWGARFFRVLIWSRLSKLARQTVWSVPEAATAVLCTPDDGRDGRPKHVQ